MGDVPAAIRETQSPLGRRRAGAADEPLRRKLPATAELAGRPLRRMVAALEAAVAVGREEAESEDVRPRHGLDDELRGERRQPPQPALLPGRDDRPDRAVVEDRGARRRKREPPPAA